MAVATGKKDGFLAVVGIFIGSFLYTITFPLFKSYAYSGNIGFVTLPEIMKLKPGIIVFGITIFAILFLLFGEFMEKYMERASKKQTKK